jgi:UDP-N-acetylglucosamine--dolichyl-phosphate N-acetylglucosaminephosphotransferase
MLNYILALIPILPGLILSTTISDYSSKRLIFLSYGIAVFAYWLTKVLVPVVAQYTKARGLCGKDMGKKGTATENKDVPEALGLLSGIVFLICTIFTQLIVAREPEQLIIFNSALFSICFMIFLGFIDDTLDLRWRYKLILPTVASLPLLSAYSGPTAVYIPAPINQLFMNNNELTVLGSFVNLFAVVDTEAKGSIIELGYLFLIFMGLLAVFCTNAINILAGINGLECGQSYVIAASIFFFKIYEIVQGQSNIGDNQLFALVLIIPFIGTSLGILRYNWFPAKIFVGDTYCYFAGMTFAVIGIHGHFSKTLLLLFVPQVVNFLYSTPQLFKLVPCPRHRLPRINPSSQLMFYSAFPCEKHQYRLLKVHPDATECPNMTIICLVLRVMGPMKESSLCIALLAIQVACSALAFYVRYKLLNQP